MANVLDQKSYSSTELPDYFPNFVPLHKEDQSGIDRFVSYALLPKKILVIVDDDKMSFSFKYPTSEKEGKKHSILEGKVSYNLANSTKKILKIDFQESDITDTNNLLELGKQLINFLKVTESRDSVKKNYEIAFNFIEYFIKEVFDPADFDKKIKRKGEV